MIHVELRVERQPTTTTTTSSTTTTTTTTTTTPSTTTTSTTTTSPSTTTTSPSTTTTTSSTTMSSTTTTSPSTTTTSPSTTATAPSATSTDAITTTLIAETTESDTNTAAVSNERTVIIVVASTVGGVVLVGLVVFLLGLFLYRARRHGHGKHKHNHKRNTRRQQSGGEYIYSGQNNGHSMAMHPSMASYIDTRHGYPHSIKDNPDRHIRVDHHKQANGKHEGSQMRNTNNVKSRYSVYPGNMVPSRSTQNFFPDHFPRQDEWQRPATTGNIHPGHVNLALQSGYTYYQPRDYSDNWNMY
ncbi:hypothetical protein MAR_021578 [Mya arenaria]|uniref:Uncharacterized protein n=1 Tax=Mya arenaria TaxID=6604 RepID=A0ABY7EAL6_MYAAR|nr:hypothetical protein MAR_021578 [Mya arenaria]